MKRKRREDEEERRAGYLYIRLRQRGDLARGCVALDHRRRSENSGSGQSERRITRLAFVLGLGEPGSYAQTRRGQEGRNAVRAGVA